MMLLSVPIPEIQSTFYFPSDYNLSFCLLMAFLPIELNGDRIQALSVLLQLYLAHQLNLQFLYPFSKNCLLRDVRAQVDDQDEAIMKLIGSDDWVQSSKEKYTAVCFFELIQFGDFSILFVFSQIQFCKMYSHCRLSYWMCEGWIWDRSSWLDWWEMLGIRYLFQTRLKWNC